MLYGRQLLLALATFCTNIIRGIPELVLMPLIYYGGTIGANNHLEWIGNVPTFICIAAPQMSHDLLLPPGSDKKKSH